MDAILARVAQIVKAKGLLAFMGLPTKEETKATVETKEEAPMIAEVESKEELPMTTEIESKEGALTTTETTLERPDPLKAVAALDNEEAMGMLEEDSPASFAEIINGTNFSDNIKTQLTILFNAAEENQLNIDKLNWFISAIDLFFADKRVDAFYKSSQEKAVVEVLKTVNIEHDYTNLEVAFLKYLKENGVGFGDDNIGGDTKIRFTLSPNFKKAFLERFKIFKNKQINLFNLPCYFGLDSINASSEFVFEKNELTMQLNDLALWEMFKKTNNLDLFGNRFVSSITTGTLKVGKFDLGIFQLDIKCDLAQLNASVTKCKELFNAGTFDVQWMSLTVDLALPTDNFSIANYIGVSNLSRYFLLADSNLKVSIKFAIGIDIEKYILDEVKDEAEQKLLKEIKDKGEKAIASVEELGKDAKNAKKASSVFRGHIDELKNLSKGLKSKPGIIAGKGLIKGVGTKVLKSLAVRGLLKLIPIVNVISTIYDVFWIGVAVYNYFNAAAGISEEDAKKMYEAKEKEFRLQQARTKQSENPRKKDFVVLLVYEGIPNDTNGMYAGSFNKSDWKRYNIYLKFYEDSVTAGQYFLNPSRFEGKMLKTGSEVVGDGTKISYNFEEILLNEKESLSYNACKILNLEGDDNGALYLIHGYNDIQRRLKINKNY